MKTKRIGKEKRNFILAIIFAVLSLFSLTASYYFSENKSASRFYLIIGIILAIAACAMYFLSVKRTLITYLTPHVQRISKQFNARFAKFFEKLKQKLGLSAQYGRMRGKDKVEFEAPSFIHKLLHPKRDEAYERLKWNEHDGNPWKIRYIYAKYIRKLTKKGIENKLSRTPLEFGEKIGDVCEDKRIFPVYTLSRYASEEVGNEHVSDDLVDEMIKLIK